MAFQVTITEAPIQENGLLIVRCLITDNTSIKVQKEYRVSSELELKTRINADIAILGKSSSDFGKVASGPYDPTITPPEDTPRNVFAKELVVLRHLKNALDLGLMDQTAVDDQVNKLKSLFDPSYVDLF